MNKLKKNTNKGFISLLIICVVLIIDQWIKIEVKTNMALGDSYHVASWFQIYFIENNGMAYGMTFINKIVLSLFRIIAVCFIGYYISKQIKQNAGMGYIVCLSLVLAGAAGNILDSMFYGMMFSESTAFSVSTFVGWGNGYAPFLMGKVVDMFYFPIINTTWPSWFPIWGGERFIFFSPVFNFADSCISVGVILLLLFFRKQLATISFSTKRTVEKKDESQSASNN